MLNPKLILALSLTLLMGVIVGNLITWFPPLKAQGITPPANAIVVETCGTPPKPYSAGTIQGMTQNTAGQLCVTQ